MFLKIRFLTNLKNLKSLKMNSLIIFYKKSAYESQNQENRDENSAPFTASFAWQSF